MCVITHKRAYRKATVTQVFGHNLSILVCMQLYPRKGSAVIVEHQFGVWIIHIRPILFELSLMEKKERKKEDRKRTKIEIFAFDFLDSEEKS